MEDNKDLHSDDIKYVEQLERFRLIGDNLAELVLRSRRIESEYYRSLDYLKTSVSDTIISTVDYDLIKTEITSSVQDWRYTVFLREILSSIANKTVSDLPDLDRLRLFLNSPVKLYSSECSIIFTTGICNSSSLLIVKVNICPEMNLLHEYLVGLRLNLLREQKLCLNFMYTYYYLRTGEPLLYKSSIFSWFIINKGPICNSEHLLLENVTPGKEIKQFILSDPSMENIICIYLQLILALEIAYDKYNFIHWDIRDNNIILRHAGNAKDKWFTYDSPSLGPIHLLIDKFIPMFIDWGNSTIRLENDKVITGIYGKYYCSGSLSPIYDIYRLTAVFLYNVFKYLPNIEKKQKLARIFINILTKMSIPLYLIHSIFWYELDVELLYPTFNSLTEKKTYKDLTKIIIPILVINEVNTSEFLNLNPEFRGRDVYSNLPDNPIEDVILNSIVRPENGLLSLCYRGLKLDRELTYVTSTLKKITNFKNIIKDIFLCISNIIKDIKEVEQYNILSLPIDDFEDYCSLYVKYFKNIMKIRTYLDELDIILYINTTVYDSSENTNLSHYIKENQACLMRIIGENSNLFTTASSLLVGKKWKFVEIVWYILNHSSVLTR